MKLSKKSYLVVFLLCLSLLALFIIGAKKNMTPSSGPQGILYVLTGERIERFDLETLEPINVFPNLPQASASYMHLGNLRDLGKLAFFDFDYDLKKDKWKTDFLIGDPRTGDVKVLFDFGRKIGLQGLSYSPDQKRIAFFGSPKGFKRAYPDAPSPPDELWICSFPSMEETLLAKDASPPSPPRFGFLIDRYSIGIILRSWCESISKQRKKTPGEFLISSLGPFLQMELRFLQQMRSTQRSIY